MNDQVRELKPCPFCGDLPGFEGGGDRWRDEGRYVEMMLSCCVNMSTNIDWQKANAMTKQERESEMKRELIEQWNARVTEPPKTEHVEPLTLKNPPLGTVAPAIGGGHWTKTTHGWKASLGGSTFPTPGGDWNRKLIPPTQAQAEHAEPDVPSKPANVDMMREALKLAEDAMDAEDWDISIFQNKFDAYWAVSNALAAEPVAISKTETTTSPQPVQAKIQEMVNRFLGWKLPLDFAPDCGISIDREIAGRNGWPSGTHLFNADQAKAMFEYVTQGEPVNDAPPAPDDESARLTLAKAAELLGLTPLYHGLNDEGFRLIGSKESVEHFKKMCIKIKHAPDVRELEDVYLTANQSYWERCDKKGYRHPGSAKEAVKESLSAVFVALSKLGGDDD